MSAKIYILQVYDYDDGWVSSLAFKKREAAAALCKERNAQKYPSKNPPDYFYRMSWRVEEVEMGEE